jgi:TRAP-type C4-dicarboxylate transport system permease small subunit
MFLEALDTIFMFIVGSVVFISGFLILFVFFENLINFLKERQDRENRKK